MSIKPILMSGSMVRAVLRQINTGDGKTQTRRAVTSATTTWDGGAWPWGYKHGTINSAIDCSYECVPMLKFDWIDNGHQITSRIRPRVEIGDMLWVRETFCWGAEGHPVVDDFAIFRANFAGDEAEKLFRPWKPSIHMPRRASRITLVVTDVRFERLQEISKTDAAAEGVAPCPIFWTAESPEYSVYSETNSYPWRVGAFSELWDNICRASGFGWEKNPWVVVTNFEPHLRNVDQMPEVAA